MRTARRLGALAAVIALVASCGGGVSQRYEPPPLSDGERVTYARRALLEAEALREEGRLDAALRKADHGLELTPDDARLLRMRALLCEALGRSAEAAEAAQRADVLDPPPPPLPHTALDWDAPGLSIWILPPPEEADALESHSQSQSIGWDLAPEARALEQRLAVRLPHARVVRLAPLEPADVAEGARWLRQHGGRAALSLQIERAVCRDPRDQPAFCMTRIRGAAAGSQIASQQCKRVSERQPATASILPDLIARCLEDLLADPALSGSLRDARSPNNLLSHSAALRALQPELAVRVAAQLDAAVAALSRGDSDAALASVRSARAIDPEDARAAALASSLESDLAMQREIDAKRDPSGRGSAAASVTPTLALSAIELEQMEARLADEQRLREQLVAAAAVLEEDRLAPQPDTLAALRPTSTDAHHATASVLARTVALERGGASSSVLEARAMLTPDGFVLARYYFDDSSHEPLLREEDADGDGRADRWISYQAGARRRVWEDRDGVGDPDVCLVFAVGGEDLERIETYEPGASAPRRVIYYAAGRVVRQDSDADGNGVPERREELDADGGVAVVEEDRNGDGRADIRSRYSKGRLVSRELLDPDVASELAPDAKLSGAP